MRKSYFVFLWLHSGSDPVCVCSVHCAPCAAVTQIITNAMTEIRIRPNNNVLWKFLWFKFEMSWFIENSIRKKETFLFACSFCSFSLSLLRCGVSVRNSETRTLREFVENRKTFAEKKCQKVSRIQNVPVAPLLSVVRIGRWLNWWAPRARVCVMNEWMPVCVPQQSSN